MNLSQRVRPIALVCLHYGWKLWQSFDHKLISCSLSNAAKVKTQANPSSAFFIINLILWAAFLNL